MINDKETAFLRDCLASNLFSGCPFPKPPDELDWERLNLLLTSHRLSAHFFVLGQKQHKLWPEAFLDGLRGDRFSLMLYGDQCAIHIRLLLSKLNKAGIPVIVLKGWSYIPTIYGGDYSQRVCEDIDILISPRDIDQTEIIMQELGSQKDMESWPGYDRRYWNGTRYFVKGQPGLPGSTFSIGLHWGLWHMPSYDASLVDIDALFERARPLQIISTPALELSVEDHIVYACAHLGLHHRFDSSLFRFYELAIVILQTGIELDWQLVLEQAKNWRVILPTKFTLNQIHALWPEVIPAWVLAIIEPLKPTRMEHFTARWIVITRGRPLFDHLLTWLTFPDWKQRFTIMLQDIFPGPQYMIHRYGQPPNSCWQLLYFRRFSHALSLLFKEFTLQNK